MFARADGVAHVMQAIEERHQIIVFRRKILGRRLRERDAGSDARFLRPNFGALARRLVVIEPEELRVRIGLRHYDRGRAVATPAVSYLGTAFERRFHASPDGVTCTPAAIAL